MTEAPAGAPQRQFLAAATAVGLAALGIGLGAWGIRLASDLLTSWVGPGVTLAGAGIWLWDRGSRRRGR